MTYEEQLSELIIEIDTLIPIRENTNSAEFKIWKRKTSKFLMQLFGKESEESHFFNMISFDYICIIATLETNLEFEQYKAYANSLQNVKTTLQSYIYDAIEKDELHISTNKNHTLTNKTIDQLVIADITRVSEVLNSIDDESLLRDIYLEITSRYDSVIDNLGDGLYSYIAAQHFYDMEVDIDTIVTNLKMILQKMIAFNAKKQKNTSKSIEVQMSCKKVFIVHGHEELAREKTARFIEKLGFEAIILHEQTNAGKTIIEKLGKYTDVNFAIVLYTPCDVGGENENCLASRARQNVVFEHGYLIAKLGRENVVALVKDEVELPSDTSGIVYETMDDRGAWKYVVAKELNVAGFNVDMNKI